MANNYSYDESVIVKKQVQRVEKTEEELILHFTDNSRCKFYHRQDCCESVCMAENTDVSSLENITVYDFYKTEVSLDSNYGSKTITNLVFN